MQAVSVDEFGGIESLVYGTRPDPVPGADEVLVRIRACAVNFVDLLVIAGGYQFLPERPFSPGKLPAGVVVAAGPEVEGLRPGDRVQTLVENGGYAELVCARAADCYRLPDGLSFVDAASMALAFDTAWFALHERARLRAGESVLVLGASGAVGDAAVQLAKAAGARVLAGISSSGRSERARESGADAVIDLSVPDLHQALRAQVHAHTGGRGVDVIVDPLGDAVFDAAIRALAWCGRLVVVGFAAGRIPTLRANYLLVKNIEVSGLQVSDYRKRMPERMAECFAEVYALHEAGRVRPPPTRVLPLAGYADALRGIRDRTATGRTVLVP